MTPITVEELRAAHNSMPLQALFFGSECASHLDLGCNDGRTLRGLDPATITAVDLFEPSVEKARQAGLDARVQDVRDAVAEYVEAGQTFDRVTMYDVIEHLEREDGERIITAIEQIAAKEIIFFVPWETPAMWQDKRFLDYREWGLSQHPQGQRVLHDHLSLWAPEDFKERGYVVLTIENFHGQGWHAFFAVKYKEPGVTQAVIDRLRASAAKEETQLPPKPAFGPSKARQAEPQARIANPIMLVGRERMDIAPDVVIGHAARLECVTQYGGQTHDPYLRIGEGTTAEARLHIGCAERVTIGTDCIIAGNVTIMDHDHGYATDRPLHGQPLRTGRVTIGHSVFVGEGAYIGKGVTIGDHAVIGAGAVVTRDVPRYGVAVGVPAKTVKVRPGPSRPLVSIVIPTWNGLDMLQNCIASIEAHTPGPYEIIVVDNGSDDGTSGWLVEHEREEPGLLGIRLDQNEGFPVAANEGMAMATGDYVCVLNNDTEVTDGWLEEMLAVMRLHPDCGLVGPMSDNVSGAQKGRATAGSTYVTRLVGFCLLIRRDVIDAIGGFDPLFGLGNYDDDDYVLRALVAGYRARIAHASFVKHLGSQTWQRAGIDFAAQMQRNRALFLSKWGVGEDNRLSLPAFDKTLHYVPLGAVAAFG